MWIDEFFTFYIARLPIPDMWKALQTGSESHPPSFLLLTHASMSLFGYGPFAMRLPAIVGFLLMEVCLFQFVAKRTSGLLALVAMLIPFTTRGISYAIEARGYGLVLGFTALSLVCWQRATSESHHRKWPLAGLAISLAAVTASHYFGAFVVLPLATGELVRTWFRRRLDAAIWIAFLAPAVPLIGFLPVIRAFSAQASNHGLLNAKFDYFEFVLFQAHALILILLFAILVCSRFDRRRWTGPPRVQIESRSFSLPEIAAVVSYLVLPVAIFALTRITHWPFADRYALSGVIGFSLLVPLALDVLPGSDFVATALIGGLICWGAGSYMLRMTSITAASVSDTTFLIARAKPDVPIAISDINTFFVLTHSAPSAVARRLVFLADRRAALHYVANDTSDRLMIDLAPWLPLKIESYCSFVAHPREFDVYGPLVTETNWLTQALTDDRVTTELIGDNAGSLLLHVRTAGQSRVCEGGGAPD